MGCAGSRSSRVVQLDPTKPAPEPKSRPTSVPSKPASADLAFLRERKAARPDSHASASAVLLRDAASAKSNKSLDSGLGDSLRDAAAALKPRSNEPATVPARALERHPQLPPVSAVRREPPADQKKILESLRAEGLLEAPETSTKKGGLCYEVPLGELQPSTRRPPPRLAKLQRQEGLDLTRQLIRDKLEVAERRRKVREKEKISRSSERDARNLSVKLALLEFDKKEDERKRTDIDTRLQSKQQKRSLHLDSVIAKQSQLAKNRSLSTVKSIDGPLLD